jgi:hypothetical protein
MISHSLSFYMVNIMVMESVYLELGAEILATIETILDTYLSKVITQAGADPNNQNVRAAYGWRLIRPDDQVMAGTALTYSAALASAANPASILGLTMARVPAGMGIVHLGWYCDAYLGEDGYLTVLVNTEKKQEIPAPVVYRQIRPPHSLLTTNGVIFVKENELIQWQYRQQTGAAITCIVYPFAFILGTKAILNMK